MAHRPHIRNEARSGRPAHAASVPALPSRPASTPQPIFVQGPAQSQPAGPARKRRLRWLKSKKRWLKWVLAVIIIAAVAALAYGYINTRNELNKAKNPAVAGKTESEQLVGQISKYIKLPSETPTIATVTNVNQLKNQEFFKDAKNGDKVLIFQSSGRALLYRESTKQVIEYAKVNLQGAPAQQ